MKNLTFLVFAVLCSVVYSQTENVLWMGGSFTLKASKKINIGFTEQYRNNLEKDSSKTFLQEIGITFKPTKKIGFTAFGRYNIRPTRNNSYMLGAEFNLSDKIKKSKLTFMYQLRFQKSNEINSFDQSSFIRNKFGFEYNLSKRIDPFLSSEIFFKLSGKNEFRFIRNSFGIKINLPKSFDAKLAIAHQKEIFVKNPVDRLIFQFSLGYTLDVRKKEK